MDWSDVSDEELEQLIIDESLDKRGKALETLGMRYAYKTNFTVAKAYLEQAIEVNDRAGDVEWASTSRQLLGRVLYNLGEYYESIAWLSEAALGFESILWHRVLAEKLHSRAASHRAAGNTREALKDFDDAAQGFMSKDKPPMAAEALKDKADFEMHLGWYVAADESLTRALDVLRTEPAFNERLFLHTQRIRVAIALTGDAEGDIQEGAKLVPLAKEEGLDLEFHAWTARYFISRWNITEAEKTLTTMVETLPDSHARKQRLGVLRAFRHQVKAEPLDDVGELEPAHMIATSYKDYDWLPFTTRLLALHHVAHDDASLGAKIIADTIDDITGAASKADVCDLEILHTEVEASIGNWDRFETFHQEVPLSFDDRLVEHFSRMLILAIRYAIHVDAPQGEIIQRLKAATAIHWLLPDEYRPGGMDGFIPEDNHVLVPVPEELREFAFEQASQLPYFNDPKTIETLGEVPLGHPVFHMEMALVRPSPSSQEIGREDEKAPEAKNPISSPKTWSVQRCDLCSKSMFDSAVVS